MNSFGKSFRVSIFGESHGKCVGVSVDGCPPGIGLTTDDFAQDLKRRRPGGKGTTSRIEKDIPDIKSGVFNGYSTGAPIVIEFENSNTRSGDYTHMKDTPRPGHADFTAWKKYRGFNDYRGGGHFSGRLTVALVAAGVIAKKILGETNIHAEILEAGGSTDIQKAVEEALRSGDSIGGIIKCTTSGLPVGLGEPFFDSAESLLSHMIFSIPAVKGIEFGSGFDSARKKGSENNDPIVSEEGKTGTNNSGGINGGITNGNDVLFKLAVKPTPSISKEQTTFNMKSGNLQKLSISGRHDACIALRIPVIVEAATAIVFADLMLTGKEV